MDVHFEDKNGWLAEEKCYHTTKYLAQYVKVPSKE